MLTMITIDCSVTLRYFWGSKPGMSLILMDDEVPEFASFCLIYSSMIPLILCDTVLVNVDRDKWPGWVQYTR